jgi:hypothetical protein
MKTRIFHHEMHKKCSDQVELEQITGTTQTLRTLRLCGEKKQEIHRKAAKYAKKM